MQNWVARAEGIGPRFQQGLTVRFQQGSASERELSSWGDASARRVTKALPGTKLPGFPPVIYCFKKEVMMYGVLFMSR